MSSPQPSPWRRALLATGLAALLPKRADAASDKAQERASDIAKTEETWLDKLLRISGLSAAPGQLRDGETAPGSVWVVDARGGDPVRWTRDGGYAWPVFGAGDGSVYALHGETLVRIAAALSAPQRLFALTGVDKLVGFDPRAPDELIVLQGDRTAPLASLAMKTGARTALPLDRDAPAVQRLLGQIRGQGRGVGQNQVLVQKQRRQGLSRVVEWTDVLVQQGGGELRNLSRCDGLSCSQPALAPDGAQVVFVKADI
jgi:hypothetical protein